MAKAELSIEIGTRLRQERERLNLQQEVVGNLLGITRYTMSNYESGRRSPDAIRLCGLADLGYDILFVLRGRNDISKDVAARVKVLEEQMGTLMSTANRS